MNGALADQSDLRQVFSRKSKKLPGAQETVFLGVTKYDRCRNSLFPDPGDLDGFAPEWHCLPMDGFAVGLKVSHRHVFIPLPVENNTWHTCEKTSKHHLMILYPLPAALIQLPLDCMTTIFETVPYRKGINVAQLVFRVTHISYVQWQVILLRQENSDT